MRRNRHVPFVLSVLAVPTLCLAAGVPGASAGEDPLHGLEYRLLGPAVGGRVARVVGVPGDPLTYYAATAAGGVWRSTDGGQQWKSVFDDQPVSSIGSVAVAPSDHNVIWVGSGEANIRGNVGEGNGVYRSTDGGETWQHVLTLEGQIGTMAVHPADPDVAFAAVLGSPFGPGAGRGVYRTEDGGASWTKVLYVDPDTGASDVCFDPSNPRILFAGLWQTRRRPWGMTSGGPGGGLYVSRDGGDTWKRLEGKGLPAGVWGKVGVRVANGLPDRVYALIEAEEGGLYRSDDGGDTWKLVNPSHGLTQRAWYYSTLTVDPNDPDVVWFPQVRMLRTIDGGASVRSVKGGGWDYHDVWIAPDDSRRMIVGSDAGVSLSRDGGDTWMHAPMAIGQLYHVSVDTRTPYRVLGSLQDYGTASGPSNSLHGGGILPSDWHPVGGGEAGFVVADPADPSVVWAGEYMGYISRYDERTGAAVNVSIYPLDASGRPPSDLRYRFQWTAPIVVSPHDPDVVYHAANVLFRTSDGGRTWQAISPDLTRDDPSKQGWSGGPITGDITGVETYDTIFAVAESPVEAGVIWAGSDDGLVHVTRDGGATWDDVTPAGFPEWATVSCIEASRRRAGAAWVVVDAHRLDDETPYLFATTDYGRTWTSLTKGLDPEVYLHVVREDTRRDGLLFLGTERGVMLSRDGGASWQSLRLDMPTVAVVDMAVAGDDLVVGTLGRSVFVLDDLTPVREMTPDVANQPLHLFEPLQAVRWRYAPEPYGSDAGAAENPAKGALLTYRLGTRPEGEVTLEILDADGATVRRLSSVPRPRYTTPEHPDWNPESKAENEPELDVEPGIHRVAWDLSYGEAHWVPGTRIDTGAPAAGPMAAPGAYTARLTVGGRTSTRTVVVAPDPRSSATAEEIGEGVEFALGVRAQVTRVAHMVETVRAVRAQLSDHAARLAGDPGAADLVALGTTLDAALAALEEKLHNPHAEVNYDILAGRDGGASLYSQLSFLLGTAVGDDGPPTQGMQEVGEELTAALERYRKELDVLLGEDLERINELARERAVPYVVVPERIPPAS